MSIAYAQALAVVLDQAPVILGPVVFVGHEVPSRIVIGGAQAVTIHRLPGGGRIIDAMGVDDSAIQWSGYFTGPIATTRARVVDALRRNGEMVGLSFGDYAFNVVVVNFEYDLQDRGALISYRIQTQIVPDLLDQPGNTALAMVASLSNDIAAATASLAGFGLVPAQAALIALSSALPLAGQPPTVGSLAAIGLALQASAYALQSGIASFGGGLPGLAVGGSPGLSSGVALTEAVLAAGSLAAATQTAGYVNRGSNWLSQLGGQSLNTPSIFA